MLHGLAIVLWSGLFFGLSQPSGALFAGHEVEVVRDLAYYDGPDADAVKHKLDLYLPKGVKDFPVLFFVHGGAWQHGDKKTWFDVYGKVARNFARHGVGAVVTNYRLSPKVRHPAHAQDVAKAFAWTYHNIEKYGGRQKQIFLCGHSAGGHLVALLATDPGYLKAAGLSLETIRGVVPISGVYSIPAGPLFDAIFGEDNEARRGASPLRHVNGQHPPALVLYAEKDFPTCDQVSLDFCRALEKCRCDAHVKEIKGRDHMSIIVLSANAGDPTLEAVLDFIGTQTGQPIPRLPPPKHRR